MVPERCRAAKGPGRAGLSAAGGHHIYHVMHSVSALLAVSLLAGTARSAAGQGPGSVEFTTLGVWHNKTTTMDGLRGFGGGARLGIWLPANFEIEGQLDLTSARNSVIDNRFQLLHVGGSLLYNIPVGAGSVYLRGGYGKLTHRGCSYLNRPCPTHGAATGAAGFRVPIAGAIQFRAEGMYRIRPQYEYRSFGASFGFSWLPSRAASSGVGPDTDRDGVMDRQDRCPDTPLGALVNSRGCSSDTDRDGVPDGIDRCPRTPPGAAVDRFGCVAPGED